MESTFSRYQVLHNEDEPSETSLPEEPSTSTQAATASNPVTMASDGETLPPSYASLVLGATSTPEDFPVPPPYSVATSLPTYDEAEKAKAAELAASTENSIPRDEDFPPRDDFSDVDQLLAFLFNWIGFCLSFCLTNTIAGRYGAICGFGLSLIKWILIVRFSDYFTGYFNGQYWLWWIFLVLEPNQVLVDVCIACAGLLLFFKGFVNYLKVRNMSEAIASTQRARFFFLY
ncbi:NEDD4 family-interacting protein 2 [Bagarius yarrelli]|uniref:NEDD4 family-interacting protein 2 n=1 Tax=Bagarius yarrelli TaxID=175774 RepID=A0A556TK91_BAGYA|nr:NEDD4 family-interacting protein 2 [Bagarius yarrelli]